jgi:23S rRNA (adenine2503-C2)-methyltransferase
MSLTFKEAYYLPSGRIFLLETEDGYPIECTEMRDVSVDGKQHWEVRNSLDPHVVWNHVVPYEDKWLLTVSTQKGCPHKCQFCDVPNLPFKGNLSTEEIIQQVAFLLKASPYVKDSTKVKIGFARMGEPAHNFNAVVEAMKGLAFASGSFERHFEWLPCFNTILPHTTLEGTHGLGILEEIMQLKEEWFDGFMHVQLSINSTNEEQRRELFGGAKVIPLDAIVRHIYQNWRGKITKRTITLNFIVMKGIEIDMVNIKALGLLPDMFTVKLIPLNDTSRGGKAGLEPFANYENYEELVKLGEEFKALGIPTVIDAIAKCEEAGLCCGQLAHIFTEKKK